MDSAKYVLRLGVLDQVADRARGEGVDDLVAIHEGREDGRPGRPAPPPGDPAGLASTPPDARHREIHQGHVGTMLDAEDDTSFAVRRGADHDELRVGLDQLRQTIADDRVIVDDRDPDHRTGTSSSIVVPAPGARPQARALPPADSARSLSTARPMWPSTRRLSSSSTSNPRPSSHHPQRRHPVIRRQHGS